MKIIKKIVNYFKKVKYFMIINYHKILFYLLTSLSVFLSFFLIKNGLKDKSSEVKVRKDAIEKSLKKISNDNLDIQRSIVINEKEVKYIKNKISKVEEEEDTEELDNFFDKRVK